MSTPESAPPAHVGEDQLRRRSLGVMGVFVGGLFLASCLAVPAVALEQRATGPRPGRRATAAVIHRNDRFWPFVGDEITVAYTVEDRRYETTMPVGDAFTFAGSDDVAILYDPADPSRARPVDDWYPAHSRFWVLVGVCVFVTIAFAGRPAVATLLLSSTARNPRHSTVLRAESFTTRRWWQRWSRDWVALWPVDVDPMRVEPALFVPVEGLPSKTVRFDPPSRVLGRAEPGRLVLVLYQDKVVWPRGRVRRRAPVQSIVDP